MATAEITPKAPVEPVGSDRDRPERRRRPRPTAARREGSPDDESPRPPRGRLDVLV
jgi:hypothetical protein